MKRVVQVPVHVDQTMNQFIFTSPSFEFVIMKKNNKIEYYMNMDDFMVQLLEKKGYVFEESTLEEDFIDCGGKLGYSFTKRNLDFNPTTLNLKYQEFIDLLDESNAIQVKVQYKDECARTDKRKLQILERQNKITISKELREMIESNDLFEIKIGATSFNLMNAINKRYNLVQNHLSTLDGISHCYCVKDVEIDLLPQQINMENTPQANITHIFEENTSTNIIRQSNSILLGKDKENKDVGIHINDFILDVGVFGASGSGKGNLLFKMLEQLHNKVPFLVIAPKGEFSKLNDKYKDIRVYDPTKYLPLNIFVIPKNTTLNEYLPHLKEILTILLELDESPSAKSFVSDAIKKTYYLNGYTMQSKWEDGHPFSLRDFAIVLEEIIKQSKYAKNEKHNFLQIMNNRISNCIDLHTVFDDIHCMNIEELLNKNTVIDLKNTPKEMLSTVMKILLILVIFNIKQKDTQKHLKNIILIDEAHNLFGRNDDYFDHTFADTLYELRSLGCGFIISDQRMSTLKSSVLDNLSQTINGRLVRNDEEYFFENKNYSVKQQEIMSTLPTGSYTLKVKATTTQKQALIHPVFFTSENVIDEYIFKDKSTVHFKLQSQPYSHCTRCKSKEFCLFFENFKEIARGLTYKYNLKGLTPQDKIKIIVHETKQAYQSDNYQMIDIKDACSCIYELLKWEERRS